MCLIPLRQLPHPIAIVYDWCAPFDFDVCSKAVTSADPRSGQRKEPLISAQCRRRPMLQRLSNKHNGGKSRGGHGGDASQIGMAEKRKVSGLGLLRMRMGVQPYRAGRWPINCRNDAALRTAARQGVHISCLCRAPEGHKKSPLAKSTRGLNAV